ncbi:hypothetical protein ES288_A08G000800v1 [Gossypium darwinii]|uniref:Uncharacterized protein n=1 Tax=Gossypium darwinii TaxID=34276 RepID=A0A5D2FFU1_GOSDA|nr:hypothetical protein ES288_A08G000800v1 [Gossypium darwinii]
MLYEEKKEKENRSEIKWKLYREILVVKTNRVLVVTRRWGTERTSMLRKTLKLDMQACHEQSEHIEEYGTRKPGKSSDLGVDMSIAGKESLRGKQFKYAVEADEDPQPSVKEKPSTTDEEYEKLGGTCTFGYVDVSTLGYYADVSTLGYYADVMFSAIPVAILFNEAAQMSPEDADVHIVLGVLYNLSREYDKAIASFKTALKLKPNDYSLWNKLGATQANSVQSADAILAYQQFEWAWQHPQESAAVRQAAATFKSFSGVTNKIKLAYMMLALPPWQSLNITVNYFSTKYTNHSASCPSLPEQMKVKVSPMDELPFYTEPNEFECKDGCDNLDEYDEVSGTCETVPETYPNEVVIFSADNLHSIIHEACHEQSEHIEEYGTRKPGKSSDLGVGNVESLVFFHPPPNKATSIATGLTMVNAAECADMSLASKESLRGMRFKYAVEADEDPQPSVKEKPPTTVEEYEKLGDACTFGVYHRQPFSVICSPVRAYSSVVTSLSSEETAEGTNISIIEKECWIQKQLSAFVAASGDQQSWRKGKPLSTEVAVLKDHVPSFDVTREPEVIDLLTPSPSYRVRPCTKKRRISKFSPEIIDLT